MTLRATILFSATSLVAAIVIGSMMVGNWGGGVLDNRIEWIYWAGAILGGVGIGLLGIAAVAGGEARVIRLTRIGLGIFLIAPVLCVIAVFTDYWI